MVAPRKVPVARTTAGASMHVPSASSTPATAFARQAKSDGLALDQLDAGRRDQLGDRLPIKPPIGLHARTAHRTALAGIEHPAMDCGPIGGPGHDAAHRVDFADQMALAHPADRRIARHLAKIVRAKGQQRHARAAARRGTSRLASGMTATNDQYVEHRPPIQARARRVQRSMFHVKRAGYLPRQNRPNSASSRSSTPARPEIRSIASRAIRSSSAIKTGSDSAARTSQRRLALRPANHAAADRSANSSPLGSKFLACSIS